MPGRKFLVALALCAALTLAVRPHLHAAIADDCLQCARTAVTAEAVTPAAQVLETTQSVEYEETQWSEQTTWTREDTPGGTAFYLETDALEVGSNAVLTSVTEVDGVLYWQGLVDGAAASGELNLLAGDTEDSVIVEFTGDIAYAIQLDLATLEATMQIGLRMEYDDIGHTRPAEKYCRCFAKPELHCTDEQCDTQEECPGGNGGPKCRWQFWSIIE